MLREILVSGLREYLAGIRIGLPVTSLAKWKTGFQMGALGTLLAGDTSARLLHLAFLPVSFDRRGDAVGRRRADPGDRLGLSDGGSASRVAPLRGSERVPGSCSQGLAPQGVAAQGVAAQAIVPQAPRARDPFPHQPG